MNTFTKFPILAGTPDPRVRRTLTPKRVMTTRGDVRGEDSLLTVLPPQVMLWTPGACLLKNSAEGEKAGVLVDFGIELHGTVTVTVTGITPKGGTIDIDYTLTFEHAVVSRNRFSVKIKEQAVE